MSLTFLVGGARSGKSALATRLATDAGHPVVIVVTGEPRDDEMADRIGRHRRDRPAGWITIEEPRELVTALTAVGDGPPAIVDCLTLWVSNLLERGDTDDDIDDAARRAAAIAAARPGPTIVVSNEVGMGIIPLHPVARRYADLLGRVNATFAAAAAQAYLVVAGRVLPLGDASSISP